MASTVFLPGARPHGRLVASLVVCIATLLTALLFGATTAGRVQAASGEPTAADRNPAYAVQNAVVQAAQIIRPSVVNIDVVGRTQAGPAWPQNLPFRVPAQSVPAKGEGSGVIISPDGLILTNEHVVNGASEITVTLADGRKFKGAVKGADRLSDIALLKIDGTNLPAARLGDSDSVPIGAFVIAVGNPLGFEQTMTFGILSGKGREIPEVGKEFRNLLQTDAAINPGNSGGPLVDLEGRVIGINTAIIRQAQGMGFAIPINSARQISDQLGRDGKITRAYIGVMMAPVTDDIARALHLPRTAGVVVDRVIPQSPAAKAGLRRGDVILEIDGAVVNDTARLQQQIRGHRVGDSVSLKIWSAEKLSTVHLRVEAMPQS